MATTAIVATVGGETSNSYVTLVEAEQYFEDRLVPSEWTAATDDNKNKALLAACRDIDKHNFHYLRYDTTTPQALAFPRTGALVNESHLLTDSSDDPIIPTDIKYAQCERALELIKATSGSLADTMAAGIKSEKIGDVSVTYSDSLMAQASGGADGVGSLKYLRTWLKRKVVEVGRG